MIEGFQKFVLAFDTEGVVNRSKLAELGARMLDAAQRFLKVEETLWSQWKFDDKGAHYIQPEDRGKPNTFQFRPEGVTLQ